MKKKQNTKIVTRTEVLLGNERSYIGRLPKAEIRIQICARAFLAVASALEKH